jgi:PAS domain S-box-containing protein
MGVDIDANSRENSFCKHLVDSSDVLVVPDTLDDERFADSPLVTGDTAIRFYAGAPLVTSGGYHLGSLCVFDQKPHVFTARQTEMLAILSNQAMHLMELEMSIKLNAQYIEEIKSQKEKIDVSERKLRAFFNSSNSCHILIGKDGEVLDFNKSAVNFTKNLHRKQIQLGEHMHQYVSANFLDEFIRCFNQGFKGKRIHEEVLIDYPGKGPLWCAISFNPVTDELGNIVSVAYSATDIDENKKQAAAINAQNNSLLNIAYIQSHEYRRPVASIIGLMELIKAEDYHLDKECLLMMEGAVHELDDKIKSVVNYTEETCSKHSA